MTTPQKLVSLPDARALIALFNHRARKSLGQHFLINDHVLRVIADKASHPYMLEVGPGPGGLTAALLARPCERLWAVDADGNAVASLGEHVAPLVVPRERLVLVEGDILRFELPAEMEDWVLVGNLPYNIGTQIFFRMLDHWRPYPKRAVLMFQREVADRFLGTPETRPDHGALALIAQMYFEIEMLIEVPPEAFRPPPKVDSAVLVFTPRPEPLLEQPLLVPFRALVKAAFAQRRKTLANNLQALWGLGKGRVTETLSALGLNPAARAEALTLDEFCALTRALYSPPAV
jgi:16S rRNA (adenine1518-N6/adenine1519-N6)-dimethyltransferase